MLLGFPLGLGYIASYLLKHGNYEVKIIDSLIDNLSIEDLLHIIRDFDPHYIGMTIYTVLSKPAVQLAQKIKKEFPDKYIIGGGAHASDDYHNLLTRYPYFDFIVKDEGEITLFELLETLNTGKLSLTSIKNVKGIAYRDPNSKEIILTEKRKLVKNLDELPPPARHLVNFEKYIKRDTLLPYSIELMSSRGCTHRCVFCSFQSVWRSRSGEEMIKEMKDLIKSYPKVKSFLFYDDNFSVHKQRVIDLCKIIIREKLQNYQWSALCRADQMNEEMLIWMKKAGCTKIMYGLESGDDSILKTLNKRLNALQVKNCVDLTNRVGINCLTFFIIGNPGETFETVNNSYKFSKQLKCESTVWSIMQVYPGTALAQWQPCEDFVSYLYKPEIKNSSDFMSANLPIYNNPALDREQLKALHKKIFRKAMIHKAIHHPFFTFKRVFFMPGPIFRFFLRLIKREKKHTYTNAFSHSTN
ncbi:MAG: radical SAM protein [Deltaproteobacteria bacterium]|nr:radical SAM protein [Deltaproteobacteria bacterium]